MKTIVDPVMTKSSHQSYKQWEKARAKGEVPPAKSSQTKSLRNGVNLDAVRDGSDT